MLALLALQSQQLTGLQLQTLKMKAPNRYISPISRVLISFSVILPQKVVANVFMQIELLLCF